MSLDQFRASEQMKGGEEGDSGNTEEQINHTDISWHISLDGYWDDVDERFYGENTPNEPPLMYVPEKLAANMDYKDDPHLATKVASQLDFNTPERYEAVVTVIFNDFSTWNWPILEGGRKLTSEVTHFIDEYMPQIVQWRAIVAGESPEEALEEWEGRTDNPDFSWMDDMMNTRLSEEDRKYLNDNADWLEHKSRVVGSTPDTSNIEIDSGDDWEDDW